MKTNAMRILDSLQIEYEVLTYEIDENEDEDIALNTSRKLGIQSELIYKTIIMVDNENRYFVFCLPADFTISLKKARSLTGSSSIDLIKAGNLLSLTGYIRGGVSPLGMKRKFPTFIEEIAQVEDYIYISGGLRGVSLKIKPEDLARACEATFESFT